MCEGVILKAIGLLSGGLDSVLAIKLILEQGIDVIAVNFVLPFHKQSSKEELYAFKVANELKVPLKIFRIGLDYLRIVRNPKHGHGSVINPCIDCKIYMLKKAKTYAKRIGAKFIITGEVLGERPMSQNYKALMTIEKEAGLKGKIVRPLSAKVLPITEAEEKDWIDRSKLLGIRGRSRKKQMSLAKKYDIKEYPTPAGGCLLTYREYGSKIKDLLDNKKRINKNDLILLRIGRHFRLDRAKVIVGRNEEENNDLLKFKNKRDYVFEVPDYGSPITLLQGRKSKALIGLAGSITAKYSDAEGKRIPVEYTDGSLKYTIYVEQIDEAVLERLRI
jgi:tRNA U34 2-thiouridine synthase MnmA/TrmU